MGSEFIREIDGFTVIKPIEVGVTRMKGLTGGIFLFTINDFYLHLNAQSRTDGVKLLKKMISSLWSDLEISECERGLSDFEIGLKIKLLEYIRPSESGCHTWIDMKDGMKDV